MAQFHPVRQTNRQTFSSGELKYGSVHGLQNSVIIVVQTEILVVFSFQKNVKAIQSNSLLLRYIIK